MWENFQQKKIKTKRKKNSQISEQQANKLGKQRFPWQNALQRTARCKLFALGATACQLFFSSKETHSSLSIVRAEQLPH